MSWQRVEAKLGAEPLENRRLVRYLLGSAVLSDLVAVARNRRTGAHGRVQCTCFYQKPVAAR